MLCGSGSACDYVPMPDQDEEPARHLTWEELQDAGFVCILPPMTPELQRYFDGLDEAGRRAEAADTEDGR